MRSITNRLIYFCLFAAFIIWNAIFWSSCANQGMGPGGGPRDSIPPMIVKSIPAPFQTQFTEKQLELTFNEYVMPEKLNEKLVVSPPLAQRPTIKTKGKTITVKINEDLIPDRTYSVDFKDGVKDYREGNLMEDYRMIFSTYDKLDTLHISGQLLDAYTLTPVENATVSLYAIENDSAFLSLRPDFIAKTDKEGKFLFDNLPSEKYRLYALVDGDNNLFFSQESEPIAFIDSLLFPSAQYVSKNDTLINGTDTIYTTGFTKYFPGNIVCLMFTEDHYKQYLNSFKRTDRNKCQFIFSEAVTDSFKISLTGADSEMDWSYLEYGVNRDTVDLWITDTTIIAKDTLSIRLDYTECDSAGVYSTRLDTLKLILAKQAPRNAKKKDVEVAQEMVPFTIQSNLKPNDFDLNSAIILTMPDPIDGIVKDSISLQSYVNDSTMKPEIFTMEQIPNSKRKFILRYNPSEATQYKLAIDSGAVHTLTGIPNMQFITKFTTQKLEFYGTLILTLNGYNGNGILQILKNSDKEEVISSIPVDSTTHEITISYLKPDKIRLKLLDDPNHDAKWNTGNLMEHLQPERVYYFQKVIKIKSNWEFKEEWTINQNKVLLKKIVDEEQEEKDKNNKLPNNK